MYIKMQDLNEDTAYLRRLFLLSHKKFNYNTKPYSLDSQMNSDTALLLSQIYDCSDGIVFGEEHFDNVSVAFLIDHITYLADLGVDTLFFEGLSYGLERGVDGLRDIKESVHDEYLRLIEVAQSNNIKIVGLDNKGCKRGEGITRGIFMNMFASKVINNTPKNKWVALVGMMHLNKNYYIDPFIYKKHTVWGISELTDSVSVIINSIDNKDVISFESGARYEALPAKYINSDVLINFPTSKYVQPEHRGKILTNYIAEMEAVLKNDGVKLAYYDIDDFAKKTEEDNYLKAIIFAFNIEGQTMPELELIKVSILNSLSIEGDHWVDIIIKDDLMIFSCHFDFISDLAPVVVENIVVKSTITS